jgi:hypothetical protein
MLPIMKFTLRAVESKLWLLLGYAALGIGSHLVVPENWPHAVTLASLWWIGSWVSALYILPDVVIVKGAEYLSPLYQQVPRKSICYFMCHYGMALACVALFVTGFTAFAGFAATFMPDGFSSLVALNILSFSLYTTAVGLALMSLLVVFAVGKEGRPKLAALVGVLIIAYLLVFHAGPGVLALAELVLSSFVSLTEGFAGVAGDSVLHIPQAQAIEDIASTATLLLLQLGVLAFLLSGKTDMA